MHASRPNRRELRHEKTQSRVLLRKPPPQMTSVEVKTTKETGTRLLLLAKTGKKATIKKDLGVVVVPVVTNSVEVAEVGVKTEMMIEHPVEVVNSSHSQIIDVVVRTRVSNSSSVVEVQQVAEATEMTTNGKN